VRELRSGARPAVRWELRLVGPVELREAVPVRTAPDVGSRKARTLLALLGARQRRMVAVGSIVEALWDGRRPRRPEAGVATLVSRLRARFGADTIIGGRAGYRLGAAVQVDIDEAARLVAEAESLLREGEPALSVVAAERGLRLLDGGLVLADHPAADWAERARDRQTGLLRRAQVTISEVALRIGEPGQACVLAEAAIAEDPLDEAAYRVLMRACAATGEPARAIRAYQRLRRALGTEFGTDPAPATQELYLAVLRGERI
jgi:DNA-binding SARP family transcriptional activator